MKRCFLITVFLFSVFSSYSQVKSIVGSWIWRDSTNAIQFFIKGNGTIEKRSAASSEDIWTKTPQTGSYTIQKDHYLIVKWADKSIEHIEVTFIGNNAEFNFLDQNGKSAKHCLFLRIVEEIVPDK
ncbi:MAG: hypothetical protein QM737_21965 [Ferruginibacter sp.]